MTITISPIHQYEAVGEAFWRSKEAKKHNPLMKEIAMKDQSTGSLLPQEIPLIQSKLQEFPNDTFEISEIYLQRPQSLAQLKQSQWFCLAHGLTDFELQNAGSLADFKKQLIRKRLVFLSLEPLKAFNRANNRK